MPKTGVRIPTRSSVLAYRVELVGHEGRFDCYVIRLCPPHTDLSEVGRSGGSEVRRFGGSCAGDLPNWGIMGRLNGIVKTVS